MAPTDIPDLPEYRDNPLIARLPPLLSTVQALQALADPPLFDESERLLPTHLRIQCIQRLGRCFEPLEQHVELENRFATLLRQGYIGRNPANGDFIRHLQDGYERCLRKDAAYQPGPVRSTATSFSLVGCSGVGKSKSIERILELYPRIVPHTTPHTFKQVVWLKLDSPHMGSPKQLCINFFRQMDILLGSTNYLDRYGSSRRSVDEMMVQMAQVASLHALGVLIIDEIQHLKQAKGNSREALLNFLVTLVNTIGVPVMIIGTLAALDVLQGDFRQARRANGLVWERLEDGPGWRHFVASLWRFQWLREPVPLTDDINAVLYHESQGIIDVVVKLFMLGQAQALRLGLLRKRPERLDAKLLSQVAEENFRMIQPMIDALRRNDAAAIARYDDIMPLHKHVERLMAQGFGGLGGSAADGPVVASEPADVSPPETNTTRARVLHSLAQMGVAEDIAQTIVTQALGKEGPDDVVSVMARAMLLLRPDDRAVKPPARSRKAKAPIPGPDSLRAIVARGKETGCSGYQSLLDAGLIRLPTADVAL